MPCLFSELFQAFSDSVGYAGHKLGYTYYISGCNQALIVPKADKDGKYSSGMWIDVQRLVHNPRIKQIVLENEATPGFDQEAPKK